MASFAIDIQDHRRPVQRIYVLRVGLGDEGSMTFEASFEYRPVEKGHTRWIARAACPSVQVGEPGNGKLIHEIFLPIQIGLSF